VLHSPDARPRSGVGVSRISSAIAETVNMVEPMPPSDRKIRSCQ
jgi:hypothetical protein